MARLRQMHQSGLSPAFKRANDVWKKAYDVFTVAAQKHIDGEISRDEFLAAQITYKAAQLRFDKAFHKHWRNSNVRMG